MKPPLTAAIVDLLDAAKEVLKPRTTEAFQKTAKEHLRSAAKKVRELLDDHESETTNVLG